jgi:hypothetical protein
MVDLANPNNCHCEKKFTMIMAFMPHFEDANRIDTALVYSITH